MRDKRNKLRIFLLVFLIYYYKFIETFAHNKWSLLTKTTLLIWLTTKQEFVEEEDK